MLAYILRKIGSSLTLLVAITLVAYALIHSGGANISQSILGENATQEQIAAKDATLGLDQPLYVQYARWFSGAVRGDLGRSWFTSQPVTTAIGSRIGVTLSVVGVGVGVCTLIAIALGSFAAIRRGWWDRGVQVLSVAGEALPNFWIGMLLISLFAISLPLFPATGFVPLSRSPTGWLSTITLPVAALVLGGVASSSAQLRGAMIDVLDQDYIRTLRARGLSERSVIFRHALRAAAPAAITVLSLQFIGMIGGVVMIEKVFALPGVGSLAVDATIKGDIPVIMGVLVTMAVIVVIVNLLVDISHAWLNPKARIR